MPKEETNPERLATEEYAELDDTPRIERFNSPRKPRKESRDVHDWKVRRHLRQRKER
jgi:hypothetical protein